MGATFKLYHPDCTSTCFLVSREAEPEGACYLVTAAHSLERIKADTATLVLRRRKPDGRYERLDLAIVLRRDGKPSWVRHPEEDVAVLRLEGPLPVPVRPLPESAIADETALADAGLGTCSPIFVLTYPQRFEANDAAFPVARQGIVADAPFLPTQPHHRYLADFTAFAGDSGGPVFVRGKDGRPLLIGIVLSQFYHDETVKTEYEERTIHHPLNLGSVLYPQFVRDTIDRAASSAGGSKPAR